MAKRKTSKGDHYIDNEAFFQEMVKWKNDLNQAEELGDPKPPATHYMGECFMKIAERLSYKPNFMNYPFRDEMIGDAIENCLMYAHNFNPEKSKNPFSYFTQMIYYAFIRRIEKEKKQIYVKYMMMEKLDHENKFTKWANDNELVDPSSKNPYADYFKLSDNDLEKYKPKKKKKKTEETTDGGTLGKLFED